MDDLTFFLDQKEEPTLGDIFDALQEIENSDFTLGALTKHYNWDGKTYKWKVELRKEIR